MRRADMAAKQQVGPIRLQGCGEGLLVREAIGKDRKARFFTAAGQQVLHDSRGAVRRGIPEADASHRSSLPPVFLCFPGIQNHSEAEQTRKGEDQHPPHNSFFHAPAPSLFQSWADYTTGRANYTSSLHFPRNYDRIPVDIFSVIPRRKATKNPFTAPSPALRMSQPDIPAIRIIEGAEYAIQGGFV